MITQPIVSALIVWKDNKHIKKPIKSILYIVCWFAVGGYIGNVLGSGSIHTSWLLFLDFYWVFVISLAIVCVFVLDLQ